MWPTYGAAGGPAPWDLGELIAGDFGRAPARDVIGRGGRGPEHRPLLPVKVLAGAALRPAVASDTVLVPAPPLGMGAGILDRDEHFARKAIVSDGRHGALNTAFVSRVTYAGGIDVKAAGLRGFEKRLTDARVQRVGRRDDRLDVLSGMRTAKIPPKKAQAARTPRWPGRWSPRTRDRQTDTVIGRP